MLQGLVCNPVWSLLIWVPLVFVPWTRVIIDFAQVGCEFSSPRGNTREYWTRLVFFFFLLFCLKKEVVVLVNVTCHADVFHVFLQMAHYVFMFQQQACGLFRKQFIYHNQKKKQFPSNASHKATVYYICSWLDHQNGLGSCEAAEANQCESITFLILI